MYSFEYGYKEVVQLLIDKGADMNIQDEVSTIFES